MKIKKDFVFPVYISKKVINSIVKTCKKNKNEVFGYLIGELYSWKDQKYIIITHNLFIKGAVLGSEFLVQEQGEKGMVKDDRNQQEAIEFNFNEYSTEYNLLKEKEDNSYLLRLGWWHSHPGFSCFLSAIDLKTQSVVFPESHMVALVVDPIANEYEFFTLDSTAPKGYKTLNYAILNI